MIPKNIQMPSCTAMILKKPGVDNPDRLTARFVIRSNAGIRRTRYPDLGAQAKVVRWQKRRILKLRHLMSPFLLQSLKILHTSPLKFVLVVVLFSCTTDCIGLKTFNVSGKHSEKK